MEIASRVRLFVTPWTVAHQDSLSMGFSRQEYWSGLPFPYPGGLPDPGIEPGSPALQADALPEKLGSKVRNDRTHTHTHTHSTDPSCARKSCWHKEAWKTREQNYFTILIQCPRCFSSPMAQRNTPPYLKFIYMI